MSYATISEVIAMAKAGIVWRAEHSWSMTAGATFDIGFVTGAREMVALNRDYFTFSTGLKVDLYEASFSGGSAMKTINRRLALSGNTPPLRLFAGVTAGTLGTAITGFEVQSTSSIRVGKTGESEPFYHEAGTSYVLRITNTGTGNQPFSFALDYREQVAQEY